MSERADSLVEAAKPLGPLPHRTMLGVRVDATSYEDASLRVAAWAEEGESRTVCVANVHVVMEAYDDPAYRQVVDGADLVTPDGMPLVWSLRKMGLPEATRVYGPTLTPAVLRVAESRNIPVGFYGASDAVLRALQKRVTQDFPRLAVVFAEAPPFRPLTGEEESATVSALRASGARILFIGLGCPKQEVWMARHRGKVDAVMLGVGAAFDFLAGSKRQAPLWVQSMGMEWLFRLATEPKRLWKRYTKHNPRFLAMITVEIFRYRRRSRKQ